MTKKYANRIVSSGIMNPADIKANPQNWRKHPASQGKALDEVLGTVGWIQEVIINKTTGNLIDGHLRVETAIKNKETEIPVKYVELTEDEERIALATFDPISAMAEQDADMLKQLLADIESEEVDVTQFFGEDVLPKIEHTEEELEAVPEVPKVAKTKRGDMYQLGEHVLMCGDSTNADDVKKLMGGGYVVADMAFYSPPYAIGKSACLNSNKHVSKYIEGDYVDDGSDWDRLLRESTRNAIESCKYVFINVQMLANNKVKLVDWLYEYRDKMCDVAIWHKNNPAPAMAKKTMDSGFEFIFIFSKISSSRAIGTRDFRGCVRNVYQSNARGNNEFSNIHGATFPIGLPAYFIGNFTNPRETVLDLFGGTGSTLIACEDTGRKCRMMELAPEYCDVIVERWEKLTGKKAELISGE